MGRWTSVDFGNAMHYLAHMNPFETTSALTTRYQTTVPEAVRVALNLGKNDRIKYSVTQSGEVVISKAQDHVDPIAQQFLTFLAEQISKYPGRLSPVTQEYRNQLANLVGQEPLNLDTPLDPAND